MFPQSHRQPRLGALSLEGDALVLREGPSCQPAPSPPCPAEPGARLPSRSSSPVLPAGLSLPMWSSGSLRHPTHLRMLS